MTDYASSTTACQILAPRANPTTAIAAAIAIEIGSPGFHELIERAA